MTNRLTWSKRKESGRYRTPTMFQLKLKGEILAIVQKAEEGWFWYTYNFQHRYNSAADALYFSVREDAQNSAVCWVKKYGNENNQL
jgi:hypothetical protein